METNIKEEMFNTLVIASQYDEPIKYAVIPMTVDDYQYFKQAHGYEYDYFKKSHGHAYAEDKYTPEVEQAVVDLASALCKFDSAEAWEGADRIRSWRKYVTLSSDIRNVDFVIAIEYI